MALPGIKVLHVQDYDYRTTCLSLAACLQEVKAWSDAHRGHVPLAILIELKDTPLTPPSPPRSRCRGRACRWTRSTRRSAPSSRRSASSCPDDVRGRRRTLEAAVLRDGWPTLAASRGKVLFLMDNAAPYRTRYLRGHPSLRGRVLFTSSAPGLPDAAFIKANDPSGASLARIRRAVRLGYVVRTRADAGHARGPQRRHAPRAEGAGQRRAVGQHGLPRRGHGRPLRHGLRRAAPAPRPLQPGQRAARLPRRAPRSRPLTLT